MVARLSKFVHLLLGIITGWNHNKSNKLIKHLPMSTYPMSTYSLAQKEPTRKPNMWPIRIMVWRQAAKHKIQKFHRPLEHFFAISSILCSHKEFEFFSCGTDG